MYYTVDTAAACSELLDCASCLHALTYLCLDLLTATVRSSDTNHSLTYLGHPINVVTWLVFYTHLFGWQSDEFPFHWDQGSVHSVPLSDRILTRVEKWPRGQNTIIENWSPPMEKWPIPCFFMGFSFLYVIWVLMTLKVTVCLYLCNIALWYINNMWRVLTKWVVCVDKNWS